MAYHLTPDPDNYVLGKGKVYFDRKDPSTGLYEGYRFLGNCPDFKKVVEEETLDHFSSMSGMKKKDMTSTLSMTPKATWTLDELTEENQALFYKGTVSVTTQSSATGSTVSITSKKDRWFSLGNRSVTVSSVADAVPTTYTVTTDYTVDTTYGRIYIVPTGSIVDGTVLTVTFDAAAITYNKIKAATVNQQEGHLMFISDNPAGINRVATIWRAMVKPSGEDGYISDDWSTIGFEAEILADETNHSDSPYFDVDIPVAT